MRSNCLTTGTLIWSHLARPRISELGKRPVVISRQWPVLTLYNRGIVAALKEGADIVICGRVTDASPVIGAAAWWYDWSVRHFKEMAGALIAGHLIECGPYACGANFSGFKEFLPELVDLAFPIAEIKSNGECFISKPKSMNGVVNKFNITAQLLYELQGEIYLNPDVVADICLLYTSPSPRDGLLSRMPSSA